MFTKEIEEPQLTEGEKFIEEFFIDENIKYEAQKKITLVGDSKSYRVVDFYLPKYDAYVEFFGKWNVNDEEKARYREKKNLFFKNRIPCVIFYPENLGIIEHAFHYRLRQELRRCGRKKELMKYLTHDFHQQNGIALVFLSFLTFLVAIYFRFNLDFGDFLLTSWVLSIVMIGGYYIYSLVKFLRDRKD
jgi:hypothetical protein